MPITTKGFGRRIETTEIPLGEISILTRGPQAWLALRVGDDMGQPFDMLLTQLRGDPIPNANYPRFVGMNEGEYSLIDGDVVARPKGFAMPAVEFPDGCLVVDETGSVVIRTDFNGVEYYNLLTGRRQRPGHLRAYYTDWELVQVLGPDEERLITNMAVTAP